HSVDSSLSIAGQEGGSLEAQTDAFEKSIIEEALRNTNGNVAATARLLKATPRIISYKISKLGITVP
ncbi:MAG TPA: helix-turn-helix domain-containing protein, partial [Victivallales bacterium]|nr:helix-turn-helix domain-containing protein [Victivallales bacterium]